jgi:hypothetical protein
VPKLLVPMTLLQLCLLLPKLLVPMTNPMVVTGRVRLVGAMPPTSENTSRNAGPCTKQSIKEQEEGLSIKNV